MDYASNIESLFDLLLGYIEKIKALFIDNQFSQFITYLFNCIPEEIRFVFFLFILLFVLGGFIRNFKE